MIKNNYYSFFFILPIILSVEIEERNYVTVSNWKEPASLRQRQSIIASFSNETDLKELSKDKRNVPYDRLMERENGHVKKQGTTIGDDVEINQTNLLKKLHEMQRNHDHQKDGRDRLQLLLNNLNDPNFRSTLKHLQSIETDETDMPIMTSLKTAINLNTLSKEQQKIITESPQTIMNKNLFNTFQNYQSTFKIKKFPSTTLSSKNQTNKITTTQISTTKITLIPTISKKTTTSIGTSTSLNRKISPKFNPFHHTTTEKERIELESSEKKKLFLSKLHWNRNIPTTNSPKLKKKQMKLSSNDLFQKNSNYFDLIPQNLFDSDTIYNLLDDYTNIVTQSTDKDYQYPNNQNYYSQYDTKQRISPYEMRKEKPEEIIPAKLSKNHLSELVKKNVKEMFDTFLTKMEKSIQKPLSTTVTSSNAPVNQYVIMNPMHTLPETTLKNLLEEKSGNILEFLNSNPKVAKKFMDLFESSSDSIILKKMVGKAIALAAADKKNVTTENPLNDQWKLFDNLFQSNNAFFLTTTTIPREKYNHITSRTGKMNHKREESNNEQSIMNMLYPQLLREKAKTNDDNGESIMENLFGVKNRINHRNNDYRLALQSVLSSINKERSDNSERIATTTTITTTTVITTTTTTTTQSTTTTKLLKKFNKYQINRIKDKSVNELLKENPQLAHLLFDPGKKYSIQTTNEPEKKRKSSRRNVEHLRITTKETTTDSELMPLPSQIIEGCVLEHNPQALLDCIHVDVGAIVAASQGETALVCEMASRYMSCAKEKTKNCIGGEFANGAMTELQGLLRECCMFGEPTEHCPITSPPRCFPLDSQVELLNGTSMKIGEVERGTELYSANFKNESIVPDEVIGYLDKQSEGKTIFLYIDFGKNGRLTISPFHLIPRRNDGYVYAHRLKVDDEILVKNKNELNWEKVKNVSVALDILIGIKPTISGWIAPLTKSGTLIVDNVIVSCYAHLNSHSFAHWAMSPMRQYGIISKLFDKWTKPLSNFTGIFRQIPQQSFENSISEQSVKTSTIPWYPKMLMKLFGWLLN
ncbi:hypothetical protein SNEBB_011047 [Seison nebaliae]|nr:hypothetical protein SNEBB_011047 [Seison nebaliae]